MKNGKFDLAEMISTDLAYAIRQLSEFSDIERALDALERVENWVTAHMKEKCKSEAEAKKRLQWTANPEEEKAWIRDPRNIPTVAQAKKFPDQFAAGFSAARIEVIAAVLNEGSLRGNIGLDAFMAGKALNIAVHACVAVNLRFFTSFLDACGLQERFKEYLATTTVPAAQHDLGQHMERRGL